MKLYWKKESPEPWEHFRKSLEDTPPPESIEFMKGFVGRYMPLSELVLSDWEKEASDTSYGQDLKMVIAWTRKCNAKKDDLLVFDDEAHNPV